MSVHTLAGEAELASRKRVGLKAHRREGLRGQRLTPALKWQLRRQLLGLDFGYHIAINGFRDFW
jgi:hypothetical protein